MKDILKYILTADNVVDSINEHLSILLDIIPEIKDMIGFEHNHPHHHLDVWHHTLLALSFSQNDFKIRLVLLLHDIGKPHCYQDLEIRHFKGHQKKSCDISSNILTRLNFDKNEIEELCYLIRFHDDIIKNSFIKSNNALAKTLFKIQFCDAMAHNPTKLEKRKKYLLIINEKVNDESEKEKFKALLAKY